MRRACSGDRRITERSLNEPRLSDPACTRAVALGLWLAAFGCSSGEPAPARPRHTAAPAAAEGELVVFAAASLREAFTMLREPFEQAHAGVELTFNFAGTHELRAQLEQGAAVDVFASADPRHMDELARAGHVTAPTVFARNEPVVVVAKEQLGELEAFSDLPRAEKIVFGTAEVPIGRYTLQILERASLRLGSSFRARVEAQVVSRELNVKQVLAKLTLGEADAAIVYRSDASSAQGQVGVLTIPAEINVLAQYPIAVVSEAAHPTLAAEWVELVLSDVGQSTLKRAGLLAPATVPSP